MSRLRRLHLVCGLMAGVCLLVAMARLAGGVVPLIDPRLTATTVHCDPVRCWAELNSSRLLTESQRSVVTGSARSRAALDALLADPSAKAALAAGETIRALPVAMLFLFLALAFRRLARGETFSADVVRSFRRASVAALVSVIANPIADTVRMSVLSPVTTGRSQLFIAFNGGPFLWGMILAGAAWTAAWALDEARETQIELAEFV